MKTITGVLFTLFVLATGVQGQGGTGTVQDAQWGVTLAMPDGWIGREGPEGCLFGSHTERSVILILRHDYGSLDALRTEAQTGLNDGAGTSLTVEGPIQSFGDRALAAALRGMIDGQQAQAYVVSVLSPHGGGVTVLTAVEPASYTAEYAHRVERIAETFQFSEPKAAPADAVWTARFKGSRLTAMSSYYSGGPTGAYVGSSEKTVIDFCSVGHFFYRDSRSLAGDGGIGSGYNASGHGGGSEQGGGRWTVMQQETTPVLQLTFQSGEVATYTITYPDEELHLDDKRFYWTTHRSPAEYRPQCP